MAVNPPLYPKFERRSYRKVTNGVAIMSASPTRHTEDTLLMTSAKQIMPDALLELLHNNDPKRKKSDEGDDEAEVLSHKFALSEDIH